MAFEMQNKCQKSLLHFEVEMTLDNCDKIKGHQPIGKSGRCRLKLCQFPVKASLDTSYDVWGIGTADAVKEMDVNDKVS